MADHEHSVIKHQEHLLLDQALLRLPSELLRKNFRSAHFIVEKDTTALKTLLRDSATAAVSGRASQQDVLKNLDAMLTRMRGVKRKLEVCAAEEARLHDQEAARIAHLDELYTMDSVEEVKYEVWNRKRLDRLIADYLLRRGYTETATGLARSKGIEQLVDIDTFANMQRIREALLKGSVQEALAWCTENKKELRKMESKLEFMLRLQQFVELVRHSSIPKLAEAISHARKFLVPFRSTFPNEVQQACGLLAFSPDNVAPPYSSLYEATRWQDLADLFVTTHTALLALPTAPLLHFALTSGLSALKTPACHSKETSHRTDGVAAAALTMSHGVCPICSTELHELARSVPYAHHTKSHLDHDLMLLPNGNVYGRERLVVQARKTGLDDGQVKDLRTGEVFDMDKLKKVFIT